MRQNTFDPKSLKGICLVASPIAAIVAVLHFKLDEVGGKAIPDAGVRGLTAGALTFFIVFAFAGVMGWIVNPFYDWCSQRTRTVITVVVVLAWLWTVLSPIYRVLTRHPG